MVKSLVFGLLAFEYKCTTLYIPHVVFAVSRKDEGSPISFVQVSSCFNDGLRDR